MAHPSRLLREPGRFERAKELTSDNYLKGAFYAGTHILTDLLMSYNIRSKIFLGPFLGDAFPEMMRSLDNNSFGSLPFLSNLVIEFSYQDCPLQDWFSYPGNDLNNSLACDNPYGFPMTNAGANTLDLQRMWDNVFIGELKLRTADGAAHAPGNAVNLAQAVGLRQPYAEYTFCEQSPMLPVPQQVSIASKNFVCYEDVQQIAAQSTHAKYSFSNLKLNQISQLYMVYVESARNDVNGCSGAKQPKWKNQNAVDVQKLGGAYSTVFAPIRWETVRILLSTKNQILGNFNSEKLGISERSQYEKFKKYSGNRCKMSLAQWRQSSQMILFSAEDINLDVFSGMHDPLSLSISFEAGRLATESSIPTRVFARADNFANAYAGGLNAAPAVKYNFGTNLIARLVMIQQEEIVLFDGGCEKKSVFWDPEVARRAAQSSLGRGETVANGPPKGALAKYQ